jgi:hypothetical protein
MILSSLATSTLLLASTFAFQPAALLFRVLTGLTFYQALFRKIKETIATLRKIEWVGYSFTKNYVTFTRKYYYEIQESR